MARSCKQIHWNSHGKGEESNLHDCSNHQRERQKSSPSKHDLFPSCFTVSSLFSEGFQVLPNYDIRKKGNEIGLHEAHVAVQARIVLKNFLIKKELKYEFLYSIVSLLPCLIIWFPYIYTRKKNSILALTEWNIDNDKREERESSIVKIIRIKYIKTSLIIFEQNTNK